MTVLNAAMTGQNAFVEVAASVFGASREAALDAFLKLRTFIEGDSVIKGMYASASNGTLRGGMDDVVTRTRDRIVGMDVRAIMRQVLLPLGGGYLGYAAAVGLGMTGAVPVIIGFLIGAILWLTMAPGSLQLIKTRLQETVDDIFAPTLNW